ncbi:DUF3953 domain-containing protein [Halobacillus shinanisalinarum]|nr:DUF3953 domain-containing protein [Halobacillus shinanisalinarum]
MHRWGLFCAYVTGIIEFQKRKADALNLLLASGFVLFVAIYTM